MPTRYIRESCVTSLTLDNLSDGAERLFWRMTVIADDYGRFDADPRVLLGKCFPLKVGKWSPAKVEKWRGELAAVAPGEDVPLVWLYRIGQRIYGAFTNWKLHQRDRSGEANPPKPKFPGVEEGAILNAPTGQTAFAATCGDSPQLAALIVSETGLTKSKPEADRPVSRRQAWEAFQPDQELQTWAFGQGLKPDDLSWVVEEFKLYWLDLPDKKLPKRPDLTFRKRIVQLKGQGVFNQGRRTGVIE